MKICSSPSRRCFFFLVAVALFRATSRSCTTAQPLFADGDQIQGVSSCTDDRAETYIVHVRKPHGGFSSKETRREWHRSFLPAAAPTSACKPLMIYSYDTAISGFAAVLTREQLEAVERKEGFVFAHPEKVLAVQTTYTPEFLGLRRDQGLWEQASFGKGMIVAVIDTGIEPNHPSFSDHGLLPPPPAKWKGRCGFSDPRLCNNKLIGAASFVRSGDPQDRSPFDADGHGTHVAGTVAGMFAEGAQLRGMAAGTAAGTAPYAHLAVYKTCLGGVCKEADILAGIDQAIHDGVDVISMSIGNTTRWHFYESSVAIGSLAAVENGIFVSCAGGNDGPGHATVVNDAPWILTVGASKTDRALRAILQLGNGVSVQGEAIYQPPDPDLGQPHRLAYPGVSGDPAREFCAAGSLKYLDVSGKFVMCARGGGVSPSQKAEVIRAAGGAAMVLMNQKENGLTLDLNLRSIPSILVSFAGAQTIRDYYSHQLTPQASLEFRGTVFGEPNSPAIASFSSRGPSRANGYGILKPDVVGPGVNILAAWPPNVGEVGPYNLQSGTSMATPHVSGISALLRKLHPDWSPAAIRSAIMTTSDVLDRGRQPITDQTGSSAGIFALGAGHVNPPKSAAPGLVYELKPTDYVSYICSLGYTKEQVEAVARRPVDCSRPVTADQLNYPSLSTVMRASEREKVLSRTLTNVGEDDKVLYRVQVVEPEGVTVRVTPERLQFSAMDRSLCFCVALVTSSERKTEFSSGMLRWVSNNRVVASPIVVVFPPATPRSGGSPERALTATSAESPPGRDLRRLGYSVGIPLFLIGLNFWLARRRRTRGQPGDQPTTSRVD